MAADDAALGDKDCAVAAVENPRQAARMNWMTIISFMMMNGKAPGSPETRLTIQKISAQAEREIVAPRRRGVSEDTRLRLRAVRLARSDRAGANWVSVSLADGPVIPCGLGLPGDSVNAAAAR